MQRLLVVWRQVVAGSERAEAAGGPKRTGPNRSKLSAIHTFFNAPAFRSFHAQAC